MDGRDQGVVIDDEVMEGSYLDLEVYEEDKDGDETEVRKPAKVTTTLKPKHHLQSDDNFYS